MSNKIYQNLTREQKAVSIAKDVLKRLRYMRNVKRGYYFSWNDCGHLTGDAQPLVPQFEKNCKVCAMGACLLSYIRLYDNVKVDDMLTAYSGISVDSMFIEKTLRDVFSKEQLGLMEHEFECSDVYKSIEDPKKRLRLIMLNIVKNNGTFAPHKDDLGLKVSQYRLN